MNLKQKYLFIIFLFFIIFFLFISESLSANENKKNSQSCINLNTKIEKIMSKFENHYNVLGFRADFYQIITLVNMGTTNISYGKISILKPSNIKWEYTEPYLQTIIYNDNTILISDPTNKQVIIANNNPFVKKGIDASLILDVTSIKKFFILHLEKEMHSLYQIKLTPKEEHINMREAYIFISKKNYNLLQVKIITLCGNEVIIKLDNFDFNSIPNQKTFELDIPKETDILRLGDCNLQ